MVCQLIASLTNVFSGSIHIVMNPIRTLLQKFNLNLFIMEPKQQNYTKINEELKELYMQRMQRTKVASQQQSGILTKQFKPEEKEGKASFPNMFLNKLIYDRRKDKPKQYVSFNALFNEEPQKHNIGFDVRKSIKSIFMSTFGFESELLEPVAQIGCNFILANDKSDESLKTIKGYSGYANWTVIFPQKKNRGYSVMHSKLWLIKFQKFLRVVVGTGNLHLGDWTTWANAFWWKDFTPRKVQEKEDYLSKDFKETLSWFLDTLIPKDFEKSQLQINLDDYDYSGVDVILIPSIPGSYPDDGKYGLSKVRHVLKKLSTKQEISVRTMMTCNTTSLGSATQQFLRDVYLSFNPFHSSIFTAQKHLKLIYPTQKYIDQETMGCAQTLFLNKANFDRCHLFKKILHRYEDNPQNRSGGNVPHLKTIICDDEQQKSDFVTFYIGSHNLTKAAWGNKTKDKYSYTNTELGLLFVNMEKSKLVDWLPFRYPPRKYQETDMPYMRG